MIIDTQEKLEQALSKFGITGEWINKNEFGFSRYFKFEVLGQEYLIRWFYNYSDLIIGNAEIHFDSITEGCYPEAGEWIDFRFRNRDNALHLKVKEDIENGA